MKIIQLINQNIPIWSILCGDHSLASEINKINPTLLSKPNFLNPLENSLRLEVFKSKRGWIYDYMKDKASFAVVKISFNELYETFDTCFKETSMKTFIDSYQQASGKKEGFSLERKYAPNIKKNYENVKDVLNITKNLEKSYKSNKINVFNNVSSSKVVNQENLWLATNRSFLVKPKYGSSIQVLDGIHRLTAYSLSVLKKKFLPKELYAFYWEEI